MAIGISSGASLASPVPDDSEIHRILSERIDTQKQGVGIVVGVVEPKGRRIVAHGHLAWNDPRLVDGDTVFEIGSITKVFTALILADMVRHNEVKLGDPVAKYLPKRIPPLQHGGKEITLVDLATHTSGLPRMPDNFAPKDPDNPYADYTVGQLLDFVSRHRLTRAIGEEFEYSNIAYGLLGHLLTRHADTDYETLVRTRVLAPLDMTSTVITLTPDLKSRLALGHNSALEAVANWDLPAIAGAGALRSTANDLMTFLEAALGYRESPLDPAFAAMLTVRRPIDASGSETALGWGIGKNGDVEMIQHAGGTGGYQSFVGFLPEAKAGVVVLSNSSTLVGIVDIGQHLLKPHLPLASPPKQRTAVAVDPELYNGYVGRYQLAADFILSVTREGERLFVQATGQQKFEVLPEGERDYFLTAVDAQVTFETDGDGRAVSLILHQNGRDMPAPRIVEQ